MQETIDDGRQYKCYAPLHENEIRLLRLRPGQGLQDLVVQLTHVNLFTTTESYEALSYQWGDPSMNHDVFLSDGSQIRVTASLHHALRDLRLDQEDRIVWADGICIDQEDVIERQKQVAMMGTVYSKASRVVTYIGPEHNGSTEAIDFAEEILRKYAKAELGGPDLQFERNLPKFGLPSIDDARYAALKAVILRGWCARSWCAQEFLSNAHLTMICGRKEFKWTLMPNLLQLSFDRALPIFLAPNASDDPQDRRQCLLKLNYLRHRKWPAHQSAARSRTSSSIPFHRLLELLHPFQASDPRDKIFALYGLVSEHEALDIPVSYQSTVEELYISVAVYILRTTATLEILYSNLGIKQFALPSWVPDWSIWQVGSQDNSIDLWFNACGSTVLDFTIQPDARLDVVGCIVDRISQRSDGIGPYFTYLGTRGQAEWIEKQRLALKRIEPHPAGIEASDVLWRSLISYSPTNQSVASSARRQAFEALRSHSESMRSDMLAKARDFVDTVRRKSRYRCLATTLKRYVAAVPEEAAVGDWICMFHGMRLLMVVRQSGPHFRLIGHAYVDGLMSGEVLDLAWYRKHVITLI